MTDEIKSGNMHNIDALLVDTFEQKAPSFLDVGAQAEEPAADAQEPAEKAESVEKVEAETIKKEISKEVKETKEAKETDVDEYGTEIQKPQKVYTEAEVQAMIRDRLSRVKNAQPEQQPAQQPAQQSAAQNAGDEGDWQVQLESFIDNTLTKREKQIQEQNWRKQQQEAQANFEIKFNEGAAKYADFDSVVHGKPLTTEMVLATRGMNDPAAFIYAASKTQAAELERISKINDPFSQAVEIGQLAERMRKSRSTVSKAPRPLDTPKGDVSEKKEKPRNIDDIIRAEEAKQRKERARR